MDQPSLNRSPLYRQVADHLRDEIERNGKPGDRLDSEEKLAARYSVSLITIRESLRLLAGEGWIERRHGKGTFIADRCGRGWTAVLIERDIGHPRASYFYLRLAQEVRRLLETANEKVKLYIGRLRPGEISAQLTCREFLDDLEAGLISGVVAIDVLQHPSWTEALVTKKLPLVGTGGGTRGHMLGLDRRRMVKEGVDLLVESGRRHLALLGWEGPRDDFNSRTPFFVDLFHAALADHGLTAPEEWIRTDLHPALPGVGWEQFREVWTAGSTKPDGLLVCEDFMFPDAATAILDMNIAVPDQLQVVTHTNRGSGMFFPFPVDKFEVDPNRTAVALVELLRGAGNLPESSSGIFSMKLVNSVGNAPANKQANR